tara:strand:+ start:462 stop:941 length:480 start_codon:yes stop_codon:yes gene_type:complete
MNFVKSKRIDEAIARNKFETALEEHEQIFEHFFIAKFLGLNFEYINFNNEGPDNEILNISFEVSSMFLNPQGTLHGGLIATIMDISMGHLLNKSVGPGATIEMKTQYIRSVVRGKTNCRAKFIKKGRSINFLESRFYDEDKKLCALATSTWKLLKKNPL